MICKYDDNFECNMHSECIDTCNRKHEYIASIVMDLIASEYEIEVTEFELSKITAKMHEYV